MEIAKRNVIPILIIAIALLIVGCTNSPATPTQEIQNNEQTPIPEEFVLSDDVFAVEAPESIKEAAYAPNLSLYKTALEEHWTKDDLIDNDVSYLCMYEPDASVWGYDIIDIDENGSEELIIGATGGLSGEFYVLYTLVNDTPKLIVSGNEREQWYICEDGYLRHDRSNHMQNYEVTFYNFDIYGERTVFEAIVYNEGIDGQNALYLIGGQDSSENTSIPVKMAEQIENRHKFAAIHFSSFADYSAGGQTTSLSSNTNARREEDKYKYLSTAGLEDTSQHSVESAEEAEYILELYYGTWYESNTGKELSFGKYSIGGRSYYVHKVTEDENFLCVTISYSEKPEPDATICVYLICPDGLEDYSRVYYDLYIEGPSSTEEYFSIQPYEYRALMEENEPDYPQNVYQPEYETPAPVQQLTAAGAKQKASDKVYNLVSEWKKARGFASTQIDYISTSVSEEGSTFITKTKVYYWYSHGGLYDGYSYAVFIFDKYTGNVVSSYVE